MKCIQSIKETKNTEVGVIKRVNDVDAESSVRSGYWKYVPKSEWKLVSRKSKTVEVLEEVTPENKKNKKTIKKSKK